LDEKFCGNTGTDFYGKILERDENLRKVIAYIHLELNFNLNT